jgi:hypothetical protein
MSTRTATWLAWSLCLLCVALAGLSLIFAGLNHRTLDELLSFAVVGALVAVPFPVIGALVASRRPENPIGWIFCGIGLSAGVSAFGLQYAFYALRTAPGSLPAGAEMAWLSNWSWLPGLGLVLIFVLLLFPDGRLPSPRWRWVAWTAASSITLMVVWAMLIFWPVRSLALLENPDQFVPDNFAGMLPRIAFQIMALTGLASVISLIVRFRRAKRDERQQLKWFTYAAALTLIAFVVRVSELVEGGWAFLLLPAVPSLPIAAGIAILKYRLYDIDVLINRTLVYGLLTATLVLVYFASVIGLQRVLGPLIGPDSEVAIVASTLAIAALFNPLRRRIQAFIDRRFYRRKYDAAQVLAAFSATARDEVDLDRLTAELVHVVEETLQPEHVSIWLREPERKM